MNTSYLLIMSVSVGVLVVIQGGINARLGLMLSNTLLATTIALITSATITLAAFLITTRSYPTFEQLKSIPLHLFLGGVFY